MLHTAKALIIGAIEKKLIYIEKLRLVLHKLSQLDVVDSTTLNSQESFNEIIFRANENTLIFVDANCIRDNKFAFSEQFSKFTIILFDAVSDPGKNYSNEPLLSWNKPCSFLNLSQITNQDLYHVVNCILNQETKPGIFSLLEKQSEIFYIKTQSLEEIGYRVDNFISFFRKKFIHLEKHSYNLRLLANAILQAGFAEDTKIAELPATIDMQVACDLERIVFCSAYNVQQANIDIISEKIANGHDLIWGVAAACADVLLITEISSKKMIEVKAILAKEGMNKNSGIPTIIFRKISNFQGSEDFAALQSSMKIKLIDELIKINPSSDDRKIALKEEKQSEELSDSLQMNIKLKNESLEQEKNTLQNLVKKKNYLIAELNQGVNIAQREVVMQKSQTAKQLREMRLEVEKSKNSAQEATEKLRHYQRILEEKNKEIASRDRNPIDNTGLEKEIRQLNLDLKSREDKIEDLSTKVEYYEENQQNLRKELDQSKIEIVSLKTKIHQYEAGFQQMSTDGMDLDDLGSDPKKISNMLKESKQKYKELKNKESELEKEIKRLNFKIESSDLNYKSNQSALEKKIDAQEKQLDDSKKRISDLLKKIEELKNESRSSQEEINLKERDFKRKIDDLENELEKKSEDLRKFKEISEKRLQDLNQELEEAEALIPDDIKKSRAA